jgi:hypothetical protein
MFLIVSAFFMSASSFGQNQAIDFNGTTDYISFGNDTNLRLKKFTIECWFKITGPGIPVTTGGNGTYAVPLITKGRSESEDNNRDINYFIGIDSTTNVLVTDFEEGSAEINSGLNHPYYGTTILQNNTWYHVAMTFNGNQMSLYLNGQLEYTNGFGVGTQYESIQYNGVASGLNSFGTPKGFFRGTIDEVRIWNYDRDILEIQNGINVSMNGPVNGLVGCWGFNESSGNSVIDSSGNNITGIIYGSGFSRVAGAPMNIIINYKPDFPDVISPLNGDTCVPVNNTRLNVHAFDKGSDTLTVKFYGRPAFNSPPSFTIVPIPDTQHYTGELKDGTNEFLKNQISWIATNTSNRNISYATQLGDCVEHGHNGGNDIEWRRADTAFSYLEDPVTTGLPEGIPFSISVGNHDQTGIGNPNGNTTFFNQFFGFARFGSRSYYGGYYGNNYDNHFTLFSASGYDFIEVSLEFDPFVNMLVLNWADSILKAYPNRKAIVTSHYILELNSTFSFQGQAIFDNLKNNPNLFLLLCGHVHDEGLKRDTVNGRVITTVLSNYQTRSMGGNGWLKLLEFRPEMNKIFVKTYSTALDMFETDWDSEYIIDFGMTPEYQLLDSIIVLPGTEASMLWSGLQMDSAYEWYATVSDGRYEQMTDLIRFSTNNNEQVNLGSDITQCGGSVNIGTSDTNYTYLWSNGSTNSFITINQTGNYTITATSIAGNCSVKDEMLVTIHPIPDAYLGSDTTVCGFINLDAATAPTFNYLWQDGTTLPFFEASSSGLYSLFIEDTITGCNNSDTVTVIVNSLPLISLGNDSTQCGGIVSIGNTGFSYQYLWSTGDTTNYIDVANTGQYILTAIDPMNGCQNADSIYITINEIPDNDLGPDTAACGELLLSGLVGSNYQYLWNDGNTMLSIIATTSGWYSLLTIDSITGCQSYDSVQIIIHAFPEINLGQDIIHCGSEITIGTSDISNSYAWSTGETTPEISVFNSGNYIVTATSNVGSCVVTDTINVTINQLPVSVLVSDTASCFPVNLDAFIGSNYLYSWQNGLNASELLIDESGQYIVLIEDVNTGCAVSDTVDVVIYPKLQIELGDDINCSPCNFNISAGTGFNNYLWSTGATSNSINITSPGLYTVVVTDQNGCTARDSIMISTATEIYPNPITDHLVINFADGTQILKVEIYDESGKAISYAYEVTGNDWIISTVHFAKGVYFIKVTTNAFEKFYRVVKI